MADTQLTNTHKNPVQSFIKNDSVQKTIEERLKSRAGQFTTSLLSAVNNNELLQKCRPETVLSAAFTAASMDLPLNQNLGFAYMIPYKQKDGTYDAQFQMGYKGFIQLAQRSGLYKTINATDVRDGEIKTIDRLSGEISFEWISDTAERESREVIGYAAFFKLLNGFEKTLYMTREEMETHGGKYSQSYKTDVAKGWNSSLWSKEFDTMARKTVIKLLLSKFGPLSTELARAIESDQAVETPSGPKYVDNDELEAVKADAEKKAAIVAAAKGETPEAEIVSNKTDRTAVDEVFGSGDDNAARSTTRK